MNWVGVFVLRGLKDGYKNENVRTQYIGDVFININCIASSCQHYMVHFNLNMNTFEKKTSHWPTQTEIHGVFG